MGTESFLAMACGGLIALMFGTVLTFAGYRLFLVLLPIWGFFFGLVFGAQTMQALFGEGFLATITSWVVGFVVAVIFAVLSYMFYMFAVALVAGSLGYTIAVGLLTWIGMSTDWLLWIIGVVAAIALVIVTLMFNLQKWVIIAATSILGAGTVIATFVMLFNPHADALANPVKTALNTSWLLAVVFLAMAIFGIVVQVRNNRNYTLETYNNW